MIHYVSFSGGRTSAFLVKVFEDLKKVSPELDVRYVFMDTGAEHPDTYRFIKDVVNHLGIDLNCVRVSINPILGGGNSFHQVPVQDLKRDLTCWRDVLIKYGSPAINIPFCTGRMKQEPFEKFVRQDSKGADFVTWLGIRSDEPRRLKPKTGIGYLALLSEAEKPDILRYWGAFDFDLRIPENLGNCEFCIKKSDIKIALSARHEPEHAAEWVGIVESPDVRTENRELKDFSMYRGRLTFSNIIKMYEDTSTDDLERRVLKTKSFDTGSCSESCEAF